MKNNKTQPVLSEDGWTVTDGQDTYHLHHNAKRRGYLSRKEPIGGIQEYHGRHGDGYIVSFPSYESTSYYIISYFLKREEEVV